MYAELCSLSYRDEFEAVDKLTIFIGYPRSGHSLIGSLLDALPHVVISHELNALNYVRQGFSKASLYYLILRQSRRFTHKGAQQAGYKYTVPGQFNGTFVSPLRVIGDKKGGASSEIILNNPTILDQLARVVDQPVKVIHVARHPLDNISTISRKHGKTPREAADFYFKLCEAVQWSEERIDDDDWLDVWLEDVIADSKGSMRDMCAFLGEEGGDDYLAACDEKIFDTPNLSRNKIEWPEGLVESIGERAREIPYLARYSF